LSDVGSSKQGEGKKDKQERGGHSSEY